MQHRLKREKNKVQIRGVPYYKGVTMSDTLLMPNISRAHFMRPGWWF